MKKLICKIFGHTDWDLTTKTKWIYPAFGIGQFSIVHGKLKGLKKYEAKICTRCNKSLTI